MNPAPMIQWAITGRCNYRCRHCFAESMTDELPLSAMERLTDRMADAGVRDVYLTGGEPLLRPDLEAILRLLSVRKIRVVQIVTNGSLLDETVLEMLAENGQQPEIAVSYDGDSGCHDWLRNAPGAEESVFRALDLCWKEGLKTASLMTLHRGNLPFLRASLQKLYKHGCSTVKVQPLLPLGRAGLQQEEVISPGAAETYEAFLDAITGYYAGEYPLRLRLGSFFTTGVFPGAWSVPMAKLPRSKDCRDRSLCMHALFRPFLTAGGKLLPCTGLAAYEDLVREAPSLLDTPLEEALIAPSYRAFCDYTVGKHLEQNQTCAACDYAPDCGGGCRLNALAFSGAFAGCDEFCCEFFLKGWREKIPGAIRRGQLEKVLNAGR